VVRAGFYICFPGLFAILLWPPVALARLGIGVDVMTSVMIMMVKSETDCFTNVNKRAKTTRDEYWFLLIKRKG